MLPSSSSPDRRGLSRHLLAALLFAVGCSGTGSSCGSSCVGVSNTLPDGGAFKYTGTKLDNSMQLRLTQDMFSQLTAANLNAVIGNLNSTGSVFRLPCVYQPILSCSSSANITQLNLVLGDSDFDGLCNAGETSAGHSGHVDANEGAPLYVKFNNVIWTLNPANQTLRAQLFLNIIGGDYYVRTSEAHSSIYKDSNGNPSPVTADIQIDDSISGQHQTEIDLDLAFSIAPDGRLLIMPTQSSLANILQHVILTEIFHVAAIPGDPNDPFAQHGDPAPPPLGSTNGFDGCSADSTQFQTLNNGSLTGSGWTVAAGAGCSPNNTSANGIGCQIYNFILTQLETQLKAFFQTTLVNLLQQQIDNVICQRPVNAQGASIACDTGHACPKDDNGAQEICDTAHGVCVAMGQINDAGVDYKCEPVALALQGTADFSAVTNKVGFPAGTKLNFYAGMGGKIYPQTVTDGGLQLAVVVGTQPASTVVPALCVPPATFPVINNNTLPFNFDDLNNQPDGGVGTYDVGIALASGTINQAAYDAFNAGALCLQVSNQTSSFVSTQLFKTFLPSLGLLTHGTDAPMAIQIRPTTAPSVRVGRGTLTQNSDGTFSPEDPLLTVTLKDLNLDFYAVIEERWVRLFTIQLNLALPVGLRTFAGTSANQLQPVLGSLTTVITNITAADNVMLAEDPSVVTDLIGAVIQFAQPLLAGILQPIALPQLLGLQLQVKGVAGAFPVSSNVSQDGYADLAIWAGISTCGGTGQPTCQNRTTHTDARLVSSDLPADVEDIRKNHHMPTAVIQASATGIQNGKAEFSYRIDGGLWSPWLGNPMITIKNPMFYVQGHHQIDVVSRDFGDDRTQDNHPVTVDFLSSYESPTVTFIERNDGSILTRARSQATPQEQLRYAYKIGNSGWGSDGAPRTFTVRELGADTLTVRVTDERGMSTERTFGDALTE